MKKDFLAFFSYCRALFFHLARDGTRKQFFNLLLFTVFFVEFFVFATFPGIASDSPYDIFEILHYRLLFFVFVITLISQSLFYDPDSSDPIPFQWRFNLFDNFLFVMCFFSGLLLLILLDNRRYFMFVDLFFLFSLYQYIFLFLFWFYFFLYMPFQILEKFQGERYMTPAVFGQKVGYIIWLQCVVTVVVELSGAYSNDPSTFAGDKYFDEAIFVIFFNLFFITVVFFFLPLLLTHIVLFVVTSKVVIYFLMFILLCVWVFCSCGVFFFIPSIWYESNDVFEYDIENLSAIFDLQLLYQSIGTCAFLLLVHLAIKVHPFSGRIYRVVSYLFVIPIFYYCICFYNLALFAGTYDYYWEWPWTYYQNLAARRID